MRKHEKESRKMRARTYVYIGVCRCFFTPLAWRPCFSLSLFFFYSKANPACAIYPPCPPPSSYTCGGYFTGGRSEMRPASRARIYMHAYIYIVRLFYPTVTMFRTAPIKAPLIGLSLALAVFNALGLPRARAYMHVVCIYIRIYIYSVFSLVVHSRDSWRPLFTASPDLPFA